jgi:membrane-associated phospholipid phosphatase
VYLAYAIGNLILMLFLFYILLNNIAYDWTGSLCPVFTVGVILSTLFLKQDYVADEIAGAVLALGIGAPLFKYFWKPIKPAESGNAPVTGMA